MYEALSYAGGRARGVFDVLAEPNRKRGCCRCSAPLQVYEAYVLDLKLLVYEALP